jgi:hypothetical protein
MLRDMFTESLPSNGSILHNINLFLAYLHILLIAQSTNILLNNCHWLTVLRATRPSKTYLKVSYTHTQCVFETY